MSDDFVQVGPDGTGKKIDASALTVNGQVVERQRVSIGDAADGSRLLAVNADGSLNTREAENPILVSGSLSGAGDIIAATDTAGYSSVTLDLDGAFVGLVQVLGSLDGSTDWFPLRGFGPGVDVAPIDTFSGALGAPVSFAIPARWVKVVCIAYTSGTISAELALRDVPPVSAADELARAFNADSPLYVQQLGQKKDAAGALIPSDAPVVISGASTSASLPGSVLFDITTTGYQSIAVQVTSPGTTCTITYEETVDGVTWIAAAGWSAGSAATPVTTSTAAGLWIFPAIGVRFRARVSSYTSGTVIAFASLRQQPVPLLTSTPAVNAAQIAGTATVTAGVNGLQAVGGNIAPGAAPTSNPVPVGGVDGSGLTRRFLLDTAGRTQITVFGGGMSANSNPQAVAPVVVSDQTQQDGLGKHELLALILTELRVLTALISELPRVLNDGRLSLDDPTVLRNDLLNIQ